MTTIQVYPAIDMKGGKCVRLYQGDYDQETVYGDSPFDMAKKFADEGATWIHLVDLDGAKDGEKIHANEVIRIAKELPVRVQIGGGIRSKEDVSFYLNNGVTRVIIGSLAISQSGISSRIIRRVRWRQNCHWIGCKRRNGCNAWLVRNLYTISSRSRTVFCF